MQGRTPLRMAGAAISSGQWSRDVFASGTPSQRREKGAPPMQHPFVLSGRLPIAQPRPEVDPSNLRQRPIPGILCGIDDLSAELRQASDDEGFPLALAIQDRLLLKSKPGELSATFVKIPTEHVDIQIELGCRGSSNCLGWTKSSCVQPIQLNRRGHDGH